MNDSELVKQILAGNQHAFRFLVSKYQRLVVHVIGRMVQQQEDIEDISQEVFMKVFKTIEKFRGESKLSTWIATIAFNTGMSHLRKNEKQHFRSYDESPSLVAFEKEEISVRNSVEREEIKKYLLKLIEKMPVNFRTVITLFYLEEFSYREIEEITGMPEGTIKSYLSRARELLKQKIEKIHIIEKTPIFALYE